MKFRWLLLFFSLLFCTTACGLGGSDVGNPLDESGPSSEELDVCEDDVFVCPGGSVLERDPELDCDFPLCPGDEE